MFGDEGLGRDDSAADAGTALTFCAAVRARDGLKVYRDAAARGMRAAERLNEPSGGRWCLEVIHCLRDSAIFSP